MNARYSLSRNRYVFVFLLFSKYIYFLTQLFIKLDNYVFMVDISGNITWKTTFL